ncbi:hypothetical protein ACIBSV_12060 [Embleya sp. NPDC050154]|uniref:hypothetical protein n=1 Tax=Embleya sp. NPDC050154 TaxID=3363988 RepID=UPI00379399E8
MTTYHAAVVHPGDLPDTYCGTVDQAHVDTVRELAALEEVPRLLREHPHRPGEWYVLREDGDLDYYVPVGGE